uniref:Uncharacterized protein n=1 Tax=Ditylenchus dipsaci TaxID=166011 RepID=A0A915CL33_9BILA
MTLFCIRFLFLTVFLLFLMASFINCFISLKDNENYDGKALTIPISQDAYLDLHTHWMEKAYSGLFASIAKQQLIGKTKRTQQKLTDCSKRATNVILHAQCLLDLFNAKAPDEETPKPTNSDMKRSPVSPGLSRLHKTETQETGRWVGSLLVPSSEIIQSSASHEEITENRQKRSAQVVGRSEYQLISKDSGIGPLGAVAKVLTRSLLKAKNKTQTTQWQDSINKVRQLMAKLDEIIGDPKQLKKMLTSGRNDKNMDSTRKITGLLRQALKLGYMLAGENTTDFDNKNVKMISPRFLSVTPGDDTMNVLSPSLFSMHNEGEGLEKLTSLPYLIKEFSGKDQQEWLNFILEAAGIEEEIDKFEKKEVDEEKWKKAKEKYDFEIRGEDGQPLYFTKQNVTDRFGDFEKRKIDTWELLVANYSKEQWKELNKTGYAVLTPEQLHMLYGPASPYNNSQTLSRLLSITNLESGLQMDIQRTASLEIFKVRHKRQSGIIESPVILSPIVNAAPVLSQAVILSPLVLSPVILTPAVLGPVILSPWVFIPVILSPRVLSPLIVNPLIFSPVVLSPLVLHPFILSPGVFNPFVLSPLVLTPLILSPQVFTPVILSPLRQPMVGSPLVLSPFVLSPLIFSPQVLFAVVLSPYALSPLIESKLIASTLILSPSWLS